MSQNKDYYWFSASLEKVNKSSITTRYKQGTLDASGPMEALDALHDRYKDTGWAVATARICTVDKDGEVVATIESGPKEPFAPRKPANEQPRCEMWKWATPIVIKRYDTAFDK